ncbi:hypothetical protein [Ruegeria sp. 6PALISEP08]|uniref:hypothetical protein n=1 Tax=Ruegeria sp. 6PALISEP08 TaxID=1225660 RepID=UPI00155D980C|nr:hypothetical protein [Ruegeria sp. 6PALISEP08]
MNIALVQGADSAIADLGDYVVLERRKSHASLAIAAQTLLAPIKHQLCHFLKRRVVLAVFFL